MDELLHYYKKIFLRIVLTPLKLIPVKKNRLFMHDDLSYRYACNPKYVIEYLLKHYSGKYQIILTSMKEEEYAFLEGMGLKVVKFNSFKYFFYVMTSKVFLTNSGGFSYIPIRKKQVVINTHHGGGAYKKVGRYVYGDTPIFRKDLLLSANNTTIFLSTCKKFSDVIADSFLVPKNIFWEIGMPRNDMLINGDNEKKESVRAKIGLNEDEKLVLYAPTYRKKEDNYFKESVAISYDIDTQRVCEALSKRFGGKWKFGFRFHPCVTNRYAVSESDCLDLSDYPDMQELMLVADVMINDFSSSMWDYMLTGKPSFMYAKDMDHYIETTDVETPVSQWPFPKAKTNDVLEMNILEFDQKKYSIDIRNHYEALGGCETGRATELVCDYINRKCFEE